MKKTIAIVLTILTGTLGVASCGGEEEKSYGFGRIGYVFGEATILRGDAVKPLKAATGLAVQKGDTLQTADKTKLEVVFASGAVMKMTGNSTLELSDKAGVDARLRQGKVMSIIQKIKKDGSVRMSTPTAVAGVRGTSFMTGVDGAKFSSFPFSSVDETLEKVKTKLAVITGKIAVKSKAGKELLMDKKGKLEWEGFGNELSDKNIEKLDKQSVAELKEMIQIESKGLSSLQGLLEEIKYTSKVLLGQVTLGSVNKSDWDQKSSIAPNTKVKQLKKTGQEVEKDYDSDDLKLKKDVF